VFFTSHSANQRLPFPGGPMAPPGVLHIARKRFLWDERLFEQIASQHSRDEVITRGHRIRADFADMFEVRADPPAARLQASGADRWRSVRVRYTGLDEVDRDSVITSPTRRSGLSEHRAGSSCTVGPESHLELYIEIGACPGPTPTRERFRSHAAEPARHAHAPAARGALHSSGRLFDE